MAQSLPKHLANIVRENDLQVRIAADLRRSRGSSALALVTGARQISVEFLSRGFETKAHNIPSGIDVECEQQKQGGTCGQGVEVRHNPILPGERPNIAAARRRGRSARSANHLAFAVNAGSKTRSVARKRAEVLHTVASVQKKA
jgi:hypothetical protein